MSKYEEIVCIKSDIDEEYEKEIEDLDMSLLSFIPANGEIKTLCLCAENEDFSLSVVSILKEK